MYQTVGSCAYDNKILGSVVLGNILTALTTIRFSIMFSKE